MNFSELFGVFFGNTAKEASRMEEAEYFVKIAKSQKYAKSCSPLLQSADKCGIMVENIPTRRTPSL